MCGRWLHDAAVKGVAGQRGCKNAVLFGKRLVRPMMSVSGSSESGLMGRRDKGGEQGRFTERDGVAGGARTRTRQREADAAGDCASETFF